MEEEEGGRKCRDRDYKYVDRRGIGRGRAKVVRALNVGIHEIQERLLCCVGDHPRCLGENYRM